MKDRNSIKLFAFDPDGIASRIHQAILDDLPGNPGDIGDCLYSSNLAVEDVVKTRYQHEFLKKYLSRNSKKSDRSFATYNKFCSTVDDMRRTELMLRKYLPTIDGGSDFRSRVLLAARQVCHEILTPFLEQEWYEACQHSNGVSLGLQYSNCNSYDKFRYPMSTTVRAAPIFTRMLASNPSLAAIIADMNSNECQPYAYVDGSSLTTVDKDDSIDRLIAIEPTVNMYLQQGIMSMMIDRLKPYLDISTLQEKHKDLAMVNSMTGLHSTIDFESASDRVSRELCKFLLPPAWFYILDLVRCDYTKGPHGLLKLPMISTMGNATTFPLETLVFFAIGLACMSVRRRPTARIPDWDLIKQVSVFGDDCILPDVDTPAFIAISEFVGFRVNRKKTFYGSIPFRESCGGDYYHGHDVRPFYIKAPQSRHVSFLGPWLSIIVNRVLKKYTTYFGHDDTLCYSKFLDVIDDVCKIYGIVLPCVSLDLPDDAGIKLLRDDVMWLRCFGYSFCTVPSYDKHGVWSGDYYRFEYHSNSKHRRYLYFIDNVRSSKLRLYLWLWYTRKRESAALHTYQEPVLAPKYVVRRRGRYVVIQSST